MRSLIGVLLVLLFVVTLVSAHEGKSLRFRNRQTSSDQGISHQAVSCILQDPAGYMWFGTEEGLFRYDGYEFRYYKSEPDRAGSLSDNIVQCLALDNKGNLWIGTINGLNRMALYKPGIFEVFRHDSLNRNSIVDDDIRALMLDTSGMLWIGTYNNGISRLHPDSLSSNNSDNLPYLEGNPAGPNHPGITALAQDNEGRIWVGAYGGGLSQYLPAQHRFQSCTLQFTSKDAPQIQYINQMVINGNRLWIATYKSGVINITLPPPQGNMDTVLSAEYFHHQPGQSNSLGENTIYSLLPDGNSGNLLIGTGQWGLNILNSQRKTVTRYLMDEKPGGLISNRILALYRDRSGIIWLGTDNGLCTCNPSGGELIHLSHKPDNPNSLIEKNITALWFHESSLWIGTDIGLDRYDIIKHTLEHYPNAENTPGLIATKHISEILHDDRGYLWVGTFGSGLWRGKKQHNGKYFFSQFTNDLELPSNIRRFITSIFQDHSKRIWIGSFGGVYMIEFDPLRSRYRLNKTVLPDVRAFGQITNIFEDGRGAIWLSSFGNGAFRLQFSRNSLSKVQQFRHRQGDDNSLSNDKVLCVSEDSTGIIWIATVSGLNRFDPMTGNIHTFTEKDGLCNDFVYGVVVDNTGDLWLSTNNGLSRCQMGSDGEYHFHNFYRQDGLQENEFNANAYHISPNGWLAFGGINGVSLFQPDAFRQNELPPPVVVTDFLIFNQPAMLDSAIYVTRRLTLSHRENFFSFEFAALDFTAPEKNSYAYKMEGFDPAWIESGNRRFATYTNLDAGEYIFRVRGSNNDGVWNEAGAAIRIVITPPPLKTWWAYCLYGLSLLSLLFAWRRYELRKTREKARLKEAHLRAEAAEFKSQAVEAQKEVEKEHMRSRIATDLHDEIGSNLSSIALIGEAMQHRDELALEIRNNFADIYRAARSSGEAIRDIVWLINPMSDQLSDLITRMKEISRTMVGSQKLTFKTTGVDPLGKLNPEVKRNLYLIYKEALNNILKHSRATQIAINIQQQEEILTILIKDNGIGFDEQSVFSGSGLRNMKSRVEDINGSLWLLSDPGKGTEIKLEVKLT